MEPFLQKQLSETQWWNEDQLVEHQFKQLEFLTDHAARTIPYWRPHFASAGVAPGRKLDPKLWRLLPVLTRRELQATPDALLSDDVPETHGEFVDVSTSGSTGMPVQVVGTELDAYYFKAFVLREHLWHHRHFAGKMAMIRGMNRQIGRYPEGLVSTSWGDAATFPFPTGPSFALNQTASISQQAEWLRRNDPDYLFTYPSNLRFLVRFFEQHRLHLPRLKQVMTTGEVLDDDVRVECREKFGVEIANTYSAMEVGSIAFQCPEKGQLHVQSEHCYVEIIDNDGRPCPPGTNGRVIITPLHNFAMPLFRYEIGDYAEVGTTCSCGRGLPVLNKIMGRVRNMFVSSNNEQFFPFFAAASFRKIAPVTQHQLVQTTPDKILARLVVERELTQKEKDRLRERIVERLPVTVVEFEFVNNIARKESGKYEDFISLVPQFSSPAASEG